VSEAPGSEERRSPRSIEEVEEYLELKAVFTAIEEFLRKVLPMIKELIDTVLKPLDGSRLGKEIAEMYRSLKESGMSEEMIAKVIDRYLEKRLEGIPTLTTLLKDLSRVLVGGRRGRIEESSERREGEGGEGREAERGS